MTNTGNASRSTAIVGGTCAGLMALALVLGLLGYTGSTEAAAEPARVTRQVAAVPVPLGVRVDLSNEGEDVLGCLLGLGYKPLAGGQLHTGPGHLQVIPTDRELCGSAV